MHNFPNRISLYVFSYLFDKQAGLFGLFGSNRPSHEVTLDLSLEELYKGYHKDVFPSSYSQCSILLSLYRHVHHVEVTVDICSHVLCAEAMDLFIVSAV